jgi:redox-sensing transcriptional repressor
MVLWPSSQPNSETDVPEVVIMRLPHYVRILSALMSEGIEMVSSQQLGEVLQVSPAQIRKDLSYFGRFGKQGRGYSVRNLLEELKEIMGLDRQWNVGLVGVGRLGMAILSYPGFAPEGFRIVAAFDADPNMKGRMVGELKVQSLQELDETVLEKDISIGIVAVPGEYAQGVIDRLVECGVKSILNYAPISPQSPDKVKIRSIDPVLSLQTMTFYLLGDRLQARP